MKAMILYAVNDRTGMIMTPIGTPRYLTTRETTNSCSTRPSTFT